MAVLGSKVVYNKDPQKVPKWTSDKQNIAYYYISGGSNGTRYAHNTQFYSYNNIINAYLSSNSVANTARTVVSLSGKKGWLTFGIGSGGNTSSPFNITTWVITVDGVATTLVCDAAAEGDTSVFAGGFGLLNSINIKREGSTIPSFVAGENSDPYDAGECVRNWSGTEAAAGANVWLVPEPITVARTQPNTCIRFEDSLIVTVATTVAASNDYKYAGVAYILEE